MKKKLFLQKDLEARKILKNNNNKKKKKKIELKYVIQQKQVKV